MKTTLTSMMAMGIGVLGAPSSHAQTRAVLPLPPAAGMTVDPTSRPDSVSFYQIYYAASEGSAARMDWAGNSSTGVAGTTTDVYKNDVLRRINFYRALCGFPSNISFDATKSAEDQQAALMMSANNTLNHTPPVTFKFFTVGGALAAANSNLSLGLFGPEAMDGYIKDSGTGNESAPHRRWLLYSLASQMGSGDIPANNGKQAANALWVIGPPFAIPQTIAFARWPNAGYSPAPLCPDRWSLSYPNASFANATVVMKHGATTVPVTINSKTELAYGDNTIVWTPSGISTAEGSSYTVTVSGITGLAPASTTYTVTFFDPDDLGQTIALSGPSVVPVQGAQISFNPIAGAERSGRSFPAGRCCHLG